MLTVTQSDIETLISRQDQYIALFGEAEYFRILNGLRAALDSPAQLYFKLGGDM